jgi:hypothetical protein
MSDTEQEESFKETASKVTKSQNVDLRSQFLASPTSSSSHSSASSSSRLWYNQFSPHSTQTKPTLVRRTISEIEYSIEKMKGKLERQSFEYK